MKNNPRKCKKGGYSLCKSEYQPCKNVPSEKKLLVSEYQVRWTTRDFTKYIEFWSRGWIFFWAEST